MRQLSKMSTLCSSLHDPRIQGQRKNQTSLIYQAARWSYVDGQQKTENLQTLVWSSELHTWWPVARVHPRTWDSSFIVPPSNGQRGESNKIPPCYSRTNLYLGMDITKPKYKPSNIRRFNKNAITRKRAQKKMGIDIILICYCNLPDEVMPFHVSLQNFYTSHSRKRQLHSVTRSQIGIMHVLLKQQLKLVKCFRYNVPSHILPTLQFCSSARAHGGTEM